MTAGREKMERRQITGENIRRFEGYMREKEYACGSIEKYVRDVMSFLKWVGKKSVEGESVQRWKRHLQGKGYQAETVNGKLSSLNSFFRFMGWEEYRVKYLKIQRKVFRSTEKELTKGEYLRLVETAEKGGKRRLALLMETVCATGIRVSEVKYITVAAVRAGRANIAMKGKIRTILIPGKLRRKLNKYAEKEKIVSGEIFLTRNGKGVTRRQIWAEMKALCRKAGVEGSKVFPHNLRHLFARTFYRTCRDMVRLADVLGHSSMETTRIYLVSSGAEHTRQMERLGLIS